MFDINSLFQDGTVEKINLFFSGQEDDKVRLSDTDILSIIFACRSINSLTSFQLICNWSAVNRPELISTISRGIVIADTSLKGSEIDISFKLYSLNDTERAFTLISALDANNVQVLNAIFSILDKKSQILFFDFLARMFYFRFKNQNILKRNGTALNHFITSIDLIIDQMSERKLTSTLLRKTKAAALLSRHDFKSARMSLEGIKDREVPYARLQIDFREACATRNFEAAQSFGISMIKTMLASPWLRTGSGDLGKFDANACLIALKRTYGLLDTNGIDPFLISGTLLGMVRDGRIFEHDKDFDIAVIGWEKQFKIFEILYKSGEYDVDIRKLRGEESSLLPVRHKPTGIACDIFFMLSHGDKFLHCVDFELGFTIPFLFSKFDLEIKNFGHEYFRVPAPYEINLSENYGAGWMFPDKGYDVLLEAPAIIDKLSPSFKTLSLDRILSSVVRNDAAGLKRKLQFLGGLLGPEEDEYSHFIRELSVNNKPYVF